jgi:hypothetical protein
VLARVQANTADDLAFVRARVVDAVGRQVSEFEDVEVAFAIQGAGMRIAVRRAFIDGYAEAVCGCVCVSVCMCVRV